MSHPFADTNELETLVRSHAGEELFLLWMAVLEKTDLNPNSQELGFFCALPMDPGQTYIACKPLIPK